MKVNTWLHNMLKKQNTDPQFSASDFFCPSNIALIKYWGKRNLEFNLPTHSSISISLNNKGAKCKINLQQHDEIIVNGDKLNSASSHYLRIINFVNLITQQSRPSFKIEFFINIPIAAGLASSACIFAALTKAISKLYDWNLNSKQLSCIARIGSGSASRSLYDGFVIWQRGINPDGSDSFAERIDASWPELRIGLLINARKKKTISSTDAMLQTSGSSPIFKKYIENSEKTQLPLMLKAIHNNDFRLLGKLAEENSNAMHATMHAAEPPVNYDNAKTISDKQTIIAARNNGLEVYYTQDAGPNLKIIFMAKDENTIQNLFPDCEIIKPFAGSTSKDTLTT